MVELNMTTKDNQQKAVQVNATVFDQPFNEVLIHQVLTAYRARARSGNSAQKTRSEVSGGGAKPWRQKGTGRARAGTIRSPLWRGGGITFAAKARNYTKKVNKKMYRGAMRSIISELNRSDRLVIVDEFTVADQKTKLLLTKLKALDLNDVLIVAESIDNNLYLASRNLYRVAVTDVIGVNPLNLLSYSKILITEQALKKLEELFG